MLYDVYRDQIKSTEKQEICHAYRQYRRQGFHGDSVCGDGGISQHFRWLGPNGSTPEGEVHGILFGQRIAKGGSNFYKVTLAVAKQILLERTGDDVGVSNVHIDRTREVADLFSIYSLIGYFHSHPYQKDEFQKTSSMEPSGTDLEMSLIMPKMNMTTCLISSLALSVRNAGQPLNRIPLSQICFMRVAATTSIRFSAILPWLRRKTAAGLVYCELR